MDLIYASGEQRDRFLDALDANDLALCARLASDLSCCMNLLPGMACEQLGLPVGSTYGSAARQILATSHEADTSVRPRDSSGE
jgi:hypothetical protein